MKKITLTTDDRRRLVLYCSAQSGNLVVQRRYDRILDILTPDEETQEIVGWVEDEDPRGMPSIDLDDEEFEEELEFEDADFDLLAKCTDWEQWRVDVGTRDMLERVEEVKKQKSKRRKRRGKRSKQEAEAPEEDDTA